MARTDEDYGIPDLDDATLRLLASNPGKYGEKSRFAARELAGRQRSIGEADTYRAALERAAYGDAGAQYGAGLKQVTNYLAGAGPLADSGAATALRRGLYSDIYGKARSRIGQGYADYLGQTLSDRRRFRYQKAMQELANKQKRGGVLGTVGGIVGGIGGALVGGPAGAAAGYGAGSSLGGGYQASDAYYG